MAETGSGLHKVKKKPGRKPVPEMVKQVNVALRAPKWSSAAVTAIQSMRQPTAAMLDAGYERRVPAQRWRRRAVPIGRRRRLAGHDRRGFEMIHRRSFLAGLAALVAAPAIVRAESLMKLPAPQRLLTSGEIVKAAFDRLTATRVAIPYTVWREINAGVPYGWSPAISALVGSVDEMVAYGMSLERLSVDRRPEHLPSEQ